MQAGVNETLFEALLEVNGIDASGATIVPVQYDPQPLVNGDVDGFFAYITNESLVRAKASALSLPPVRPGPRRRRRWR